MDWKPLHDAHSIERVRVILSFKEPVPSKTLTKASKTVIEKFEALGFTEKLPAQSSIQTIPIEIRQIIGQLSPEITKELKPSQQECGWILRRMEENEVREEAGFRDSNFGYVTVDYGRWENFKSRFNDVFSNGLETVLSVTDLDGMRLEYWDTFFAPESTDLSQLLRAIDPNLPDGVSKSQTLWHSHLGWIEDAGDFQLLVNKNLDCIDGTVRGEDSRVLRIYTKIEIRNDYWKDGKNPSSSKEIENILDQLHKRSNDICRETLTDEYCEKVGLNINKG